MVVGNSDEKIELLKTFERNSEIMLWYSEMWEQHRAAVRAAERLNDSLDSMAEALNAIGKTGVDSAELLSRWNDLAQQPNQEEESRTNRQESFGKLFRKKGRRW